MLTNSLSERDPECGQDHPLECRKKQLEFKLLY